MSIELSLTTKINSAFHCYFMPVTPNERVGYALLFAACVMTAVVLNPTLIAFKALKLVVDGVIGAVAYLVTVAAYRTWQLNGAEEKYFNLNVENGSFEGYKELADCGHAKAQNTVGLWYSLGKMENHRSKIRVNLQEAFRYHKLASDRGNGLSSYCLAVSYYSGRRGVPLDYGLAFNYFQLSANQGFIDAHLRLAEMYRNGEGTNQDLAQIFKHFKIASDSCSYNGHEMLAKMYEKGEGCTQDYNKAFNLYKLAAEVLSNQFLNVARLYNSSIEIDAINEEIKGLDEVIRNDPKEIRKWRQEKALELYLKVDTRGQEEAFYYAGLIYQDQGKDEEARAMYQKIIDGGGESYVVRELKKKATFQFSLLKSMMPDEETSI